MCSPCQSGSVNQCQVREAVPPGEGGDFDWVMRAPMRAPVKDCCVTDVDPASGRMVTTCDLEQGCGWVAENDVCRFTTDGGVHSTLQSCVSENPGAVPGGETKAWFPPCEGGNITNCYYPSMDACLPSVFGKMRQQAAAAQSCERYVCEGQGVMGADGRMSFPAGACKCAK